jgi:hypothetical protein
MGRVQVIPIIYPGLGGKTTGMYLKKIYLVKIKKNVLTLKLLGESSNTMKLNSLILNPNCMHMSYTYPMLSIGYIFFQMCIFWVCTSSRYISLKKIG